MYNEDKLDEGEVLILLNKKNFSWMNVTKPMFDSPSTLHYSCRTEIFQRDTRNYM